jgi:hypothetical protein
LIYIENTSKAKVLGATSDGKVIQELLVEGRADQLWKKGEPDAEGYFTLQNSGESKFLTAFDEWDEEYLFEIKELTDVRTALCNAYDNYDNILSRVRNIGGWFTGADQREKFIHIYLSSLSLHSFAAGTISTFEKLNVADPLERNWDKTEALTNLDNILDKEFPDLIQKMDTSPFKTVWLHQVVENVEGRCWIQYPICTGAHTCTYIDNYRDGLEIAKCESICSGFGYCENYTCSLPECTDKFNKARQYVKDTWAESDATIELARTSQEKMKTMIGINTGANPQRC